MAAMPRMKGMLPMGLVGATTSQTLDYNDLQLKHLKARTQMLETLSVLLMLFVLAVIIAPVIALIVWLI